MLIWSLCKIIACFKGRFASLLEWGLKQVSPSLMCWTSIAGFYEVVGGGRNHSAVQSCTELNHGARQLLRCAQHFKRRDREIEKWESHRVLWSLMLLQYSIEFSHPVCGEAIGII